MKILAIALVGAAAAVAVTSAPEIKRYLKVRNM
jgi:Family of unknown function (DUF6893)